MDFFTFQWRRRKIKSFLRLWKILTSLSPTAKENPRQSRNDLRDKGDFFVLLNWSQLINKFRRSCFVSRFDGGSIAKNYRVSLGQSHDAKWFLTTAELKQLFPAIWFHQEGLRVGSCWEESSFYKNKSCSNNWYKKWQQQSDAIKGFSLTRPKQATNSLLLRNKQQATSYS